MQTEQGVNRFQLAQSVDLYLGDCLEVMQSLPSKSVDITLTSIPFLDEDVQGPWYEFLEKFHEQRRRITVDYSFEFHSSTRLDNLFRRTSPYRWLVWYEKQVQTPYRWQPILVYKMDTARYNINAGIWQDHFTFPLVRKEEKIHINQDPVGPYLRCLRFVKKCGDISKSVIDPFVGSGTSGIAAMQAGMKFTGIEIERQRLNGAIERIENELVQRRLFFD